MKLVIFDVDGTLIFSEKKDSLAFAATYESIYRRPFPTIDWHTYPHVTDTTIFDSVIRQHFGGPFSKIIYIGDAIWDVQTTRNLQMDFIGVRRQGDFSLLQKEGARHIIRDYLDYAGFLQLLEEAVPPGLRAEI